MDVEPAAMSVAIASNATAGSSTMGALNVAIVNCCRVSNVQSPSQSSKNLKKNEITVQFQQFISIATNNTHEE